MQINGGDAGELVVASPEGKGQKQVPVCQKQREDMVWHSLFQMS